MRRLFRLLLLLWCTAAATACNDKPDDEPAGSEIRRYAIASHRIYIDNIPEITIPVLCYLVRPDGENRWQWSRDRIEGFDYVPGTEYDVELEVIPVADPPADAPNSRFRLHRIIGRQTKTSEGLPEGAVLE